ncbi:MAG: tRNA uridine-5-carboxymethylaminomethyl(34) synthesis GTPase MnmE [Alphaproteobacteria bacterium]|nr:tRNA uridine-5-carboxymethylaminomethyl(34) synthesis GTPase MnmE [Alphaproteobacteria bacterium]
MNSNDTIFALSSGHGKSGVAVIRISGDDLYDFMARIVGKTEIKPRHAYFTNLTDNTGDMIDQCLVIYFKAPNSFTGTDIIEIHTHGAPAVIEKVFQFLSDNNMRMATPGEFSRRAFYNNKMDLADIDGLAALLDATTDRQRKMALQSMTGGDSKIYNTWRESMIEIAAFSAAILDYSYDELPSNIEQTVRMRAQNLYNEISVALTHAHRARAIRGGFNIVLAGPTNAGKSSIFNQIVGTNRAIVSDIPGTTRDVVSSIIDIDGYMVNLIDTAGLRDVVTDRIEKIGISRTYNEIENADLVLRIASAESTCARHAVQANEIIVINKSDLMNKSEIVNNESEIIYISAKTGDGIDVLMNEVRRRIHSALDSAESELVINARTHGLLTIVVNELADAINTENIDMFTEHVRTASDAIGKILGVITTSDVMDATFSQLCLGK